MQKDNKSKRLAILFWTLTTICFCIIFYFSSRTANVSAMQSSVLLELIRKMFKNDTISDFIIRKSAHFMEYVGTCLMASCAWYFTKGNKQTLLSIATVSLYAITDEVHQIFVDGRSCEFRDWCIDTAGAILGAISFIIILTIIKTISDKIKTKNN